MTPLDPLRQEIDAVDELILTAFIKRMSLVQKISRIKKEENLPTLQPSREEEVLRRAALLVGKDLAPYAEDLMKTLMRLSRSYQEELR